MGTWQRRTEVQVQQPLQSANGSHSFIKTVIHLYIHSFKHSFIHSPLNALQSQELSLKICSRDAWLLILHFSNFQTQTRSKTQGGEWDKERRKGKGGHNCLDTYATCRVAFSNCNPQFVGLHARLGPTNIGSTCDAYYAIIAMNTMNTNPNMNMNISLYIPSASSMSVVVLSRHLRIIQI